VHKCAITKFEILPINLPLGANRLRDLMNINSQHLCASAGSLYVSNLVDFGGHATKLYAVTLDGRAFSQKFSIATAAKLLIGSEKS